MTGNVYQELTKVCYDAMTEGTENQKDCVKTIDDIVIKYYYKTDQIKIKYKTAKTTIYKVHEKLEKFKTEATNGEEGRKKPI